ncbi:hypothetical protein [Alterisphingorhabdus coralli]|uniref:Mlr4354 like protein n=1 Tax=Alterisphingorhabdus coralli TaxID=3071408 RepID=A0AA97F566_9SPHN|nr:hypothetical protein [Parasphingorhabdus sp. SCSIO 66989]WOE74499.1 hypothetical protein RB602_11655 [Parasphingorhabdus sp. SCSIO 66989]
MRRSLAIATLTASAIATPVIAKDSLGVFESWGAFRDADISRCYAIAKPAQINGRPRYNAYASIGWWPKRQVRAQVHFRLSRPAADGGEISLMVGNRRFTLTGGNGDAWAKTKKDDAAIIAAIRSARSMSIRARSKKGGRITDRYTLPGAATAMDAAALACARR